MIKDFSYWVASLQEQFNLNVFEDYIPVALFYNVYLPNFNDRTSMGQILRLRKGENLTEEEQKIRSKYLL